VAISNLKAFYSLHAPFAPGTTPKASVRRYICTGLGATAPFACTSPALVSSVTSWDTGHIAIGIANNYFTKYGEVALTEAVDLVRELHGGREVTINF
jgi:hypothetical protein